MANVYWFGGTGNWSDHTNHWSNNSGNIPASLHGSAPGTDDSVIFDTLSNATDYTVTIDAVSNCLDFTMGAPSSGKVTLAGSETLSIYGSLNLSGGTAGITTTYTGLLFFRGSIAGKTVDVNGVVMTGGMSFNGTGSWTLSNDVNLGTGNNFSITSGNLNVNGKTITCNVFNITGGATTFLTMGAATVYASGYIGMSADGMTFDCGTSTFYAYDTDAVNEVFRGRGYTFYNVILSNVGTQLISGAENVQYLGKISGKDNFMYQIAPTTNYGTSTVMYIYDRLNYTCRPLLSFDISEFPGGTIESAVLYLYYYEYAVTDPVGKTIKAYKQTRNDWTQTGSTWNKYDGANDWTAAGGDFVTSNPAGGSTTVPAGYGWMSWDIINIVNDAILNVSSQVNLLLRFDTEDLAANYGEPRFYSNNYTTDLTLRPKLVITYSNIKTYNTNPKANIKTINTNPIANVKSLNTNP